MALHAFRLTRSLAGRNVLLQRPALAVSALPQRGAIQPLSTGGACGGVQSRNYQLPSWLWPFGGDATVSDGAAAPTTPVAEVPVEPSPEPLEIVTGFTRDGAFVPVDASTTDFSPAGRWAHDAMTPNLHDFGLGSYYTPPGWLQNLYVFFVDNLQFSALAALGLMVLLLRLPSIPLFIKALQNKDDIQKQQLRMQELTKDVEYFKSIGQMENANKAAIEGKRNMRGYMKNMLPIIAQFGPIGFLFFAIRKLCYADFGLLANGHFLWLPTLTAPDPYFVLPVCSAALVLSLIVTNSEAGMGAVTTSPNRIFIYGAVGFSGVVMAFHPAASVLVITMNSLITLIVSRSLKLKPIATALKIPEKEVVTQVKAADVKPLTKMTAVELKERMAVAQKGLTAIPAVKEFLKHWGDRRAKADHSATEKEKFDHYQEQVRDAALGKLRAFRDRPE